MVSKIFYYNVNHVNQNQLVTQIGYRIRTASRNFVTSTEITTELDRSLDRLSGMVDLQETITTTTIAFTADGSYALPSDFKKPISLYDRGNNHSYKRVSLSELYDSEDDSLKLYTIDGSNIIVERGDGSATLTLVYYSTNDAKTSGGVKQKGFSLGTDIPLLEVRFHDYFVEDVAATIFRKERKYDDYQISKSEARAILKDIYDANPTREEEIVTKIVPYPENYD